MSGAVCPGEISSGNVELKKPKRKKEKKVRPSVCVRERGGE